MKSNGLYFRFVAVIGALLVGGCATLDQVVEAAPKPEARILGAGVRNLSVNSLDLVFDVEVTNPYSVSLPLVDLSYTIASGEQPFLSGNIKPSGAVPANGSSLMQLPARVDIATLVNALSGVRPGSVIPYDARISVAVETPLLGQIELPVRRRGEIPVPAIPEFALVSFDIAEIGPERVSATARLRIRNTNRFDIDIASLAMALSLGGKNVVATRLRSSSKLAAGQSAVLDIPITFSPSSISAGVLDLLSGNDASYTISGRLDATTRFGPLTLPYNERGAAPMRRQ